MSSRDEISSHNHVPAGTGRDVRRRTALKVVVAGLLLIGLALALLVRAIGSAREAANKATCQSHLKQIGLALQNYLAANGSFPPAYTVDADGKSMHSWRALILPYFEGGLANSYDFSKPWDSPENRQSLQETPYVYRCASDFDAPPGTTNYLVVVGPNTLWPNDAGRKPDEITDGLSNTIAVVEVTGQDIPWTKPVDLRFEAISFAINPADGQGISSHHDAGANFLMADGTVRFLHASVDAKLLRSLFTAADGDTVLTQ